jgi:D-3-phosphoglycerate dehydrogenase
MNRILVTPRSLTSAPPSALDELTRAGFHVVFSKQGQLPSEAELMRLLPGCVGWLAGVEPVSEAVVTAADQLQVISRNGSGVDNLPMTALEARGIVVARAVGANAAGVAELAIALLLSAARSLPETAAGVRAGRWPRLPGIEVGGRMVGVVGMGAIGRRVATALLALGARVVAHDPFRPTTGLDVPYLDLPDLIATSDAVTLHCPMPPDGRPLFDESALARLPPGAILVNTARAGLVDEDALLARLNAGHLRAYATDVFAKEPAGDDPLARHPRVIGTSHVGALTEESVQRATEAAVANLLAALTPKVLSADDHAVG